MNKVKEEKKEGDIDIIITTTQMAELIELAKLETKAERAKSNGGWKDALDVLNHIRFHHIRKPRTVINYGIYLLSEHQSKLGPARWDVYEQTCVAALDFGETSIADQYVKLLEVRWPDSARVARLKGMVHEAKGEYDEANKIYNNMLDKSEANTLALKRQVSILRAKGDYRAAVMMLTDYMKNFSADVGGWQELGNLQHSLGQMNEAAYCYEELILGDPHNYFLHTRYAELLYSIGGIDKIRAARRHFVQAVHFKNKMNARATLGACMSANALITAKGRNTEDDGPLNKEVHSRASSDLLDVYENGNAPNDIKNAMKNILKRQSDKLKSSVK